MDSDGPLNRIDQFGRIEGAATLKDILYIFDVGNVYRGIAFNDYQVGVFAGRKGTDAIRLTQELRGVRSVDADRFFRREACFDQ